ncbi:galactokinase [Phaeacidiphilus oryzae]|uniref:galactokinase n=1 Tax=Phaeacidiphilus oryzae TaxID=348818 RepID=UPI000561ACEA|nr:galactokinase [Phaeacidiphilus oryzae]
MTQDQNTPKDRARKEFAAVFGRDPEGVWQAPGRVNVIGEHTDYNEGLCLPVALPYAARAAVARREDGLVRVHSAQADGVVEARVAELAPGREGEGWAAYVLGVLWALCADGHGDALAGGLDVHMDSDVPTGAGLSSSAALECAVAAACRELYGLDYSDPQAALLAQRAENAYVGVPCGVLDQMAAMCCAEGSALVLDCRDVMTVHQVPFDPAAEGLALLVVDTRVKHTHGDNEYAARRAGCERAAGLLGVPALRDVRYEELDAALERLPEGDEPDGKPGLRRLVRHIVTDDHRVERVAELVAAGRLRETGALLTEGHASLRDDYRISCLESDLVVETAVAAGALGARQTGGGFGGCVVVLVEEAGAEAVTDAVAAAFAERGLPAPRAFSAKPSAGARRLD